jgi:hypothetical protein
VRVEWDEEEETRLTNLVICGAVSLKEISRILGRSEASIRKKMISKNLRIVAETMEERDVIINEFKRQRSIAEIALDYKKSIANIKNVLSWGREQGLISINRNISGKWAKGDAIKATRMASLVDDRRVNTVLNRDFDVAKFIKSFWNLNIDYLIGVDVEEFVEMFLVTEEDLFTIITTTITKSDGKPLHVVPWVDCELFETRNQEVEIPVAKMATFQKMLYQEMDRERVIEKMVKITENKYTEDDYSPIQ